MATTRKPRGSAKKTGTEIANWDDELAKYATEYSESEANAGGGQFFSLRNGILTWQDSPVPDNQMYVIILDSVLENVFYEGKYDPDIIQNPTCYAFGRHDKEMRPHQNVFDAGNSMAGASGLCQDCEMNEWGSADVGRGKACRNTRRLALIPAGKTASNGDFIPEENPDHYTNTQVGFLKLPVTSVNGYANYVKQLAGALKRPPFAVITKIEVVPDPKNQFAITFQPVLNVSQKLISIIVARHDQVSKQIDFPYPENEEPVAPPPRRGRRGSSNSRTANSTSHATTGRKTTRSSRRR